MTRPSMSVFMHHSNVGEALMLNEKGTIVKTRDIQWIGVNDKHKSVYSAVLEDHKSACSDKANATKGVSA